MTQSYSMLVCEQVCHGCGCSDLQACPQGCWWCPDDPSVCSNCKPRRPSQIRKDLAYELKFGQGLTLKALGARLGVCRERARQIAEGGRRRFHPGTPRESYR